MSSIHYITDIVLHQKFSNKNNWENEKTLIEILKFLFLLEKDIRSVKQKSSHKLFLESEVVIMEYLIRKAKSKDSKVRSFNKRSERRGYYNFRNNAIIDTNQLWSNEKKSPAQSLLDLNFIASDEKYERGLLVIPLFNGLYMSNTDYGSIQYHPIDSYEELLNGEIGKKLHFDNFVIIGLNGAKEYTYFNRFLEKVRFRYFNSSKSLIKRTIVFPPEYHQAGMGILNFFGSYIKKKYPEEEVLVRVEQDDQAVRLIIEKNDGETEVIEKALREYQQIVSGQRPPEEFTDDKILILELKNELNIARMRIQNQSEILSFQKARTEKLELLLEKALSPQVPTKIEVNPKIMIYNSNIVDIQFNQLREDFKELASHLPGEIIEEAELSEMMEVLDKLDSEGDSVERKKSILRKVGDFLKKAVDANNKIGTAVRNNEYAVKLLNKIIDSYNLTIKQVEGLSQVIEYMSL